MRGTPTAGTIADKTLGGPDLSRIRAQLQMFRARWNVAVILWRDQPSWEAAIIGAKVIRGHRALLSMAVVLLSLVAAGFWWHLAWGLAILVFLAMWLGSGAMPGRR